MGRDSIVLYRLLNFEAGGTSASYWLGAIATCTPLSKDLTIQYN